MLEIPEKQTVGLSLDESKNFLRNLGDERLVNSAHAAAFLNVSPRTIAAWCANMRAKKPRRRRRVKEGEKPSAVQSAGELLPYIKLGHQIFFMIGDLRRFRDSRRVSE